MKDKCQGHYRSKSENQVKSFFHIVYVHKKISNGHHNIQNTHDQKTEYIEIVFHILGAKWLQAKPFHEKFVIVQNQHFVAQIQFNSRSAQ